MAEAVDETPQEDEADGDNANINYSINKHFSKKFVRITMSIARLKTKLAFGFKGFLPEMHREPKNADVNVEYLSDAVKVTVVLHGGTLEGQMHKVKIEDLKEYKVELSNPPSYHEVKDDQILLYLRKEDT